MASISTFALANNLVKNSWSKYIRNVVPEENMLQREFPFQKVDPISGVYLIPLITQLSQGYTFHAPGSTQNLNPANSPNFPRATVDAPATTFRERITYELIRRLGNDTYFNRFIEPYILGLKVSHTGMNEAMLLYGQSDNGFGQIESVAGNVLKIYNAEWATGLWTDRVNALFDVYRAGVYVKTVTIKTFSIDNATPAFTLTVDNGAGILANDVLRPNSASISGNNEIKGIHSILTERTNYFGVPNANEPLLQGQIYDAANQPLTFQRLLAAVTQSAYFGFMGECVVFVNLEHYKDLVSNVEAARTFGGDQYKTDTMKRGYQILEIFGPEGTFKVYGHKKVKRGFAYGLCLQSWERVGVTDIQMQSAFSPNVNADSVLFPLQDANAYELRMYSQYSVVCHRPAANFIIKNIVPSTP